MAETTPNLQLYKVDPVVDGDKTFNIKRMLNDNWDELDKKVATKEELSKVATEAETKVDETTNVRYRMGYDNGRLFFEEV